MVHHSVVLHVNSQDVKQLLHFNETKIRGTSISRQLVGTGSRKVNTGLAATFFIKKNCKQVQKTKISETTRFI